MTKATNAFCERVRATPPRLFVPQITVNGQTAFMRDCSSCNLMAPHKLVEGGSECGICGRFTARFVPLSISEEIRGKSSIHAADTDDRCCNPWRPGEKI